MFFLASKFWVVPQTTQAKDLLQRSMHLFLASYLIPHIYIPKIEFSVERPYNMGLVIWKGNVLTAIPNNNLTSQTVPVSERPQMCYVGSLLSPLPFS